MNKYNNNLLTLRTSVPTRIRFEETIRKLEIKDKAK